MAGLKKFLCDPPCPLWLAFVVFLLLTTPALGQKSPTKKKSAPKAASTAAWKASSYHGITPGKSKKADVIKALGKPSSTRKPPLSAFAGESCCEELVYKGKGLGGGDLAVAIGHNGPVIYIIDAFPKAMTRTGAHKLFGSDYHERTYSIAHCAESGGVAPLYRDPNGALELAEYPSKGALLWPSDDSYDYFGLVYLARAPGLAKPPACVAYEKPKAPAAKKK